MSHLNNLLEQLKNAALKSKTQKNVIENPLQNETKPTADKPEDEKPTKKIQKKKNRCWMCRKKVGVLGFDCKCGYIFCAKHRYMDEHNCTFDVKKEHREMLIKNNPKIVRDKFNGDRID